jgi:hypothetical protein
MNLESNQKNKVIVGMQDYIQGILNDAPDDMSGIANTPVSSFLFQINYQSLEFLDSITADILYTCG